MLRVKIKNSFNLLRIFFFISSRWFRDLRWYWRHSKKLDVGVSIIKLQSEVLNLFLKILYHYVALAEKGIILSDLVLSVAYHFLVLSYHLVSGINFCLKLFYLSNVPI